MLIMIGATLATHLGLGGAVAEVFAKIAGCNMCATFWLCLFILIVVLGFDPFVSALLAIVSAYLSNWFALVLGALQRAYTHIYNKVYEDNKENNNRDQSETDGADAL